MSWVFALLLQIAVIAAGIRQNQRAGQWSWRLFIWLLAFAALECAILILPIYEIHDVHHPCFWPVFAACWLIGLANMIWMIRSVRRWKPRSINAGRTAA